MCDHNHGCSHEASEEGVASAVDDVMRYDMQQHIDLDKVTVLNEATDGSGKLVFKSMDTRNDRSSFVDSDCDEELLFNIPFTGHIRLTGISISGDEECSHPAQIRLYKDRPAMSFDDCTLQPDQEIDLKQDSAGDVDYPLKASKFSNLTHLTIHVSKNFGADETRVYYIGLRGEFIHEFRQRIAIATYEARAMMKDHKGEIPDGVGKMMF